MNPIFIILFSAALHAFAFWLLIRHMRAERRRHQLPVIGSHPVLTEALHKRLSRKQPQSDWLNPSNLRAKVNAWLRTHSR